jgi:hypothetical protein
MTDDPAGRINRLIQRAAPSPKGPPERRSFSQREVDAVVARQREGRPSGDQELEEKLAALPRDPKLEALRQETDKLISDIKRHDRGKPTARQVEASAQKNKSAPRKAKSKAQRKARRRQRGS